MVILFHTILKVCTARLLFTDVCLNLQFGLTIHIWPNSFTSILNNIITFSYYFKHKRRLSLSTYPKKQKKSGDDNDNPTQVLVSLFTSLSFYGDLWLGYRGIVYYNTYSVSILKLRRLAVSDLLSTAIPGKDSPLSPKIIQ